MSFCQRSNAHYRYRCTYLLINPQQVKTGKKTNIILYRQMSRWIDEQKVKYAQVFDFLEHAIFIVFFISAKGLCHKRDE